MSEYEALRIRKPNNLGQRRDANGKNKYKKKYIVGFDSEADTTNGRPMLFQFSLPEQDEEDTLVVVVPQTTYAGLAVFLDFVEEYCTERDIEYLVYGWNTAYELTQIFRDLPKDVRSESEFNITNISDVTGKKYKWTVTVFNFKRQMVVFQKGRIRVTFLDGMAFYKTSLDKGARMLGLGEKYELGNLSRTTFTRADLQDEEFLAYSKRDAYITRLIGEYIQHQHKMYDIPTCISAPHFAATVFKTQFLKHGIPTPSNNVEQAGLYSYHGGKNGFYLTEPTDFPRIWQYDITSAYPEAMRQLPDIESGYWGPTSYVRGIHGLYKVFFNYLPCIYRPLQLHNGSRAEAGPIEGVWLTSYELDTILEFGEADAISSISGYRYSGESGGALSIFVDRFFRVKRNSSGPERETAKLLLNSLYGKFFQKQPLGTVGTYNLDELRWASTDPSSKWDYEAGGLYHPPIASLITGYVRAKIHRLEHKYHSIMTSTDGIFGIVEPDLADIGSELGQLTTDEGRLRIWRERLYIFDGLTGSRKYALHGFHAKVGELEEIPLQRGEYEYFGLQMITLKMSTRMARGLPHQPGEFVNMLFTLRL